MPITLVVRVPGEPPAEYQVEDQPLVCGRDPASEVPIPSQYVSRKHFQVEPDGSNYRIVNAGGRNPVLVNGSALDTAMPLHSGDVITIADVTIDVLGDTVSTGTVIFAPRPQAAPNKPSTTPGTGGGMEGFWSGQHMGPGGTLTIMFTDLERSTSMVTELGENKAYGVMNKHNAILREQFKAYRGHEAKRVGDGFLVLFTSARDAITCAIEIQRNLADEVSDFGPIRVRIGIHVGEVLWDDNDIFGSAVNFSARVMSEAQGGQVFISALLHEVIAVSGEFSFGEEIVVPLKGFKGTHRLTPVDWGTTIQ